MVDIAVGKKVVEDELLDLFEPPEGSVNFYYGRIGNGKTYAATADVLEFLAQGRVVYVNWHINYEGFDERLSGAHRFFHFVFGRRRFYRFKKENLRYFSPDDVDVEFLGSLTDCDIFIDEGQWIFDSYEGRSFSKEKRRLILHTRHVNRSLNIISQRTQAVQVSARGQVNRFFRCSKKMEWPWLIFRREEFQDMSGDDVDETADPVSVKVYFAKKEVLNAYDTKYLREGIPKSQEVQFEAYDLNFRERLELLLGLYDSRLQVKEPHRAAIEAADAEARETRAARASLAQALRAVTDVKRSQFRWSRHVLNLRPADYESGQERRQKRFMHWLSTQRRE